jgi:endonuclease/exonuclease/phosphatase family metal-dependent hydrolase
MEGVVNTVQSLGRRIAAAAAVMGFAAMLCSPAAHAQTTLRVLQMNLCNSGLAGCYEGGRAVGEAASRITSLRPDIVTLNEVCSGDVRRLLDAMQTVWPGQVGDDTRGRTMAFAPAWNASTNQTYKCRNGEEFGNGILWHSSDPTAIKNSGLYSNQDTGSEKRSWQCVQINPSGPYACTTHLSAASEPVALAQCRELMSHIASATGGGAMSSVVGADLNLEYDTADPENAQNCVPGGYYRKGDGSVQHFIAHNSLAFVERTTYRMSYTDHPAFLLVTRRP